VASSRRDPAARLRLTAARRILVLAPHPDDEVVACGVAAYRARTEGARISAVYLTTGVPGTEVLWPWQRRGYAARVSRRREEAIAAAGMLGLEPKTFLDIPSRELLAQLDAAYTSAERAIAEIDANELWVPAFEGAHQDHDAANALAAFFRERLPVWEFAAYNLAGGRARSNRFADARGGAIELNLSREEKVLKRRALSLYRSERVNLAHIRTAQEVYRPLPRHDYGAPPHAGRLFRERFQWVPVRHPRIDFMRSSDLYASLGKWAARDAPCDVQRIGTAQAEPTS
jgi:N-acetylglucosamine malate deacetylase 1